MTSLMSIVTDTITTPASISDGTITKTLPNIWPVKYSPEMVLRDTSITYDAGSDWNQACATQAATIENLFDVIIQTITTAASNSPAPSYLTTITRDTGYNGNSEYQFYTCENVTSAVETLFDLMTSSLGGGSNSDKSAARRILFNKHAVSAKSFAEVQTA